jgi:POT family proton-dependent oligopeptide transporter
MLLPFLLWWGNSRLIKLPPQGSVVPDALRVLRHCFANGGVWRIGRGGEEWWAKAKPSRLMQSGADMSKVVWDDQFVEEVRQTVNACVVFLLIPIFILADGGMGNNMNDMSTAMVLQGIPNDLLGNFNSICE